MIFSKIRTEDMKLIFKVQKPVVGETYLIYNKDRTIVNNFLKVGDDKEFDKLFGDLVYKIFVKGYVDKKGRLVLSRRVEEQNW